MKTIKYTKANYPLVFKDFKLSLEDFLQKELKVLKETESYGQPWVMSGSRETQFKDTYVRDVFKELEFGKDVKLTISYYSQESSNENFEKSWMYSFNSFKIFLPEKKTKEENEFLIFLETFILNNGFKLLIED